MNRYTVSIIVHNPIEPGMEEQQAQEALNSLVEPFEGKIFEQYVWAEEGDDNVLCVWFHSSTVDLAVKLNNALLTEAIYSYSVKLRK